MKQFQQPYTTNNISKKSEYGSNVQITKTNKQTNPTKVKIHLSWVSIATTIPQRSVSPQQMENIVKKSQMVRGVVGEEINVLWGPQPYITIPTSMAQRTSQKRGRKESYTKKSSVKQSSLE